ncbi:hypothetical protein EYC80_009019 [Monilinia laxa]|uniref:Uncharacterized protein n=1 Tax=Monilinia laxa TaxID=61186 RepID=A0A5N6K255_MONLA|nr:hypothetical protein EYC80_009019 [Monilinia laxa]
MIGLASIKSPITLIYAFNGKRDLISLIRIIVAGPSHRIHPCTMSLFIQTLFMYTSMINAPNINPPSKRMQLFGI